MALYQSKQILAGMQLPTSDDSADYVPVTGEFVVPTGGLAINDVIEFGGIPFGSVAIWGHVHFDAMGASATADWGYLSGTYGKNDASRTCGNDFAAALNVASAGVSSITKPQFTASQTDESTQGWGMKVTGAGWPAGARVRATILTRPAPVGMA